MSTAQSRDCDRCGHPFIPKRSDARFCSDSCRAAANRTRTARRSDNPRAATDIRAAADSQASVRAWEPATASDRYMLTTEPCPECGGSLHATLRGTQRACLSCGHRVIPDGVRAPYERGTAAVRQVKSQREHDLEAIGLAARKGVMLVQLGKLAADDRLHPESRPVVEWFADEVKAAAGQARLDELAALLPQAGIRRRRWWGTSPAALDAGTFSDGDDDQDDAEYDGEITGPAIMTAAPAAVEPPRQPATPRQMTWAGAMAACGWRLSPTHGGCQIIDECGQRCGAETMHPIGDAWICQPHNGTLAQVITRDYYRQRQGNAYDR